MFEGLLMQHDWLLAKELLTSLDPKRRLIVRLRISRYTYKEIGSLFGFGVENTRMLYAQALGRMRSVS